MTKVVVRTAASKGRGVFANQNFKTGQTVGIVEGEIKKLPFESLYCIDFSRTTVMEPSAPFRYLNHSCDPNCALLKGDGKLIVDTLRPIKNGEELTIDYGWGAHYAIPCQCGSSKCRGWIVDKKELKKIVA